MEAYQHVCSRESRRRLAQVMVDLMYQRPRIELNSTYFVLAYRYECAILRIKTAIMKHCLNVQVSLPMSTVSEHLKKLVIFFYVSNKIFTCIDSTTKGILYKIGNYKFRGRLSNPLYHK